MTTDDDIKRWFKHHIARTSEMRDELLDGPVTAIRWRNPDTSNYWVEYIVRGSRLFVTGDLGSAVYTWSQVVTPHWIANCDADYFAGKCEASENGRRHEEWEPSKAETLLKGAILEHHRCGTLDEALATPDCKDISIDAEDLLANCGSKDDYIDMMREHGDALLGCDWWEFGEIGMTISLRCRAHLIGLQMAVEQLAAVSK